MKKSYFLMRNQDYEYRPDESTGWLNLGSVLTRPTDPESLLEEYSIIPPQHDMPIKYAWQEDFKNEYEERRSRGYGIFAKFLELLPAPLGLDATYSRESISTSNVSMERLETYFMTPTKSYLDQVLSTPAVQKYLREKDYFSSPYLVTGIRVARHGSGSESANKSSDIELHTSIDAGALSGVSGLLDIGPRFSHARELKRKKNYAACSDYIYAYRLAKIYYSVRGHGPKMAYREGQLYDLGLDSKDYSIGDDSSVKCEAQMGNDGWVPAGALPFNIDDEDGDPCEIILVKG
jgi:hypothetical protein